MQPRREKKNIFELPENFWKQLVITKILQEEADGETETILVQNPVSANNINQVVEDRASEESSDGEEKDAPEKGNPPPSFSLLPLLSSSMLTMRSLFSPLWSAIATEPLIQHHHT